MSSPPLCPEYSIFVFNCQEKNDYVTNNYVITDFEFLALFVLKISEKGSKTVKAGFKIKKK